MSENSFPPAPLLPLSWGEAIDKLTILEIKRDRIKGEQAQANIRRELAPLAALAAPVLKDFAGLARLKTRLKTVNEMLWEIEDAIREKERESVFDSEFVALARSVYMKNDERSLLKRDINRLLSSELTEEKSYKPFK